MPVKRPIGTPRTTRLRKLECECGNIAYQSRVRLQEGLMRCPCGQEMIPANPEDAALVLSAERLESHPAVLEYRAAVSSALHGQAGPARSLRSTGKRFRSPDEIAAERVELARRERATANRLNALRRPSQSEPIPF